MELKIGNRLIGDGHPALIVAELSCNHNQDYATAVEIIKEAKKAGADAIKLQTYTPDTITLKCDKPDFQIKHSIWKGQTLHDLYQKAYTPWDWQPKLKKLAESLGLLFFSSPFDKTAVDFLEKMNVPCYKIASFEITDIPLIEYIASKQKPIIISTGIAEQSDIEEAIDTCKRQGNNQIILLKCTSEYPTPLEDMNLKTIQDMRSRFNCLVGLSDHSEGILAPVIATTLGATLIEKHLMLEGNRDDSPDFKFSLTPSQLEEMVNSVRNTEKAIGKIDYSLSPKIKQSREFSRSLYVVLPIKAGEKLTEQNVKSIRPAFGMHTRHYKEILGKTATQDIEAGIALNKELFK